MIRHHTSRALHAALAAAALWLASTPATAQDWVDGRATFKANCAVCHQVDGVHPVSNAQPLRNVGAATLQAFINSPPGGMTAFPALQTGSAAINDDVRKIAVYLAAANLGRGTLSPSSLPPFASLPGGRSQESAPVDVQITASTDPTHGASLPDYGPLSLGTIALSDNTNFRLVGHNCPATLNAGASCIAQIAFRPQSVNTFSGRSLSFPHDGLGGGNTLTGISGTGTEPRPIYNPGAGFAALASGFTTDTSGSVTLCPTIGNTGLFDALNVSVAALVNGGTDYSGYYEIDASPGACTSPPVRCVPAGAATVTGSFAVASGQSCTLALKFNPGKFGFAGGTGTRPATLRVTHDGYTTASPATTTMGGVVTAGPIPRIGVSTTPSANGAGLVLPAAFASQVVGTASTAWADFSVANTGTADGLQIASVTQTNTAEFMLTQNCTAAAPLARLANGGATCSVSLVFTPAAAPTGLGQRCTTVTVRANVADIADEVVQVCGTGVPVPVPAPTVDPTAIDFGRRSIGAVYVPRTLTIANGAGATADLVVSAVTIDGGGFAFVPDASACAGRSLARGTSCTVSLQFTPGATPDTPYSANVLIDSNDPVSPRRTVPLAAFAVASALPVLQWQSGLTSVSFPDLVAAGQSSAAPQVARLVNAGPGATDVQSVRLVGADAASFSATGCPAQLFEGESCDIRVSFLPGSGGAKQAQLQVVTSGGVAPAALPVSGQAVGGSSPYLVASMTTVAFADVRVGAQSQPVELRLTAAGDGVVTVSSLAVQGPFEISSVSCPPVPFTLRLGTDCTVAVRYVPTDTAAVTGTLTVGGEAPARALAVALEGSAQPKPDTSGGGCSAVDGRRAAADPVLWLLVLAAAGVLWRRRHAAGQRGKQQR